jgi:RNA polymerase sigma-70 factor (ECF subfamily)
VRLLQKTFDVDRQDLYTQFRQLFQEFYDPLCKYAFHLITDRDSSEDIVQEVFTRIWEKHQDVVSSPKIRAYLYQAVRNSCFTFLEQKKRSPVSHTDWQAEEENTITWDTNDAPAEDNMQAYRDLLRDGIDQLPAKCREVFLLSRSGHLSNQEIADNLGISVNTVNNQTWKAMKLLRAFVQKAKLWALPLFSFFLQDNRSF